MFEESRVNILRFTRQEAEDSWYLPSTVGREIMNRKHFVELGWTYAERPVHINRPRVAKRSKQSISPKR